LTFAAAPRGRPRHPARHRRGGEPGGAVDRLAASSRPWGRRRRPSSSGSLVFVFYYLLDIAPAPLGRLDVVCSPPDEITGFWSIMPLCGDHRSAAVLAQHPAGRDARPFRPRPLAITRASMIEVLASGFVHTARAAGLPAARCSRLRLPRGRAVLNTAGMVFSYMLGASVLVQKVFVAGHGAYAIDAVLASDFAPVRLHPGHGVSHRRSTSSST
jgi:hypothetical protein